MEEVWVLGCPWLRPQALTSVRSVSVGWCPWAGVRGRVSVGGRRPAGSAALTCPAGRGSQRRELWSAVALCWPWWMGPVRSLREGSWPSGQPAAWRSRSQSRRPTSCAGAAPQQRSGVGGVARSGSWPWPQAVSSPRRVPWTLGPSGQRPVTERTPGRLGASADAEAQESPRGARSGTVCSGLCEWTNAHEACF